MTVLPRSGTSGRDSWSSKEIDISVAPLCWFLSSPLHCCFCPYSGILRLEADEAIRKESTLCGKRSSHRPYSDLGSVETSMCLCFMCVDSNLGTIITGYGCDYDQSNEIVHELKARARDQQAAQQLQSSQVDARLSVIEEKLSLVLQHIDNTKVEPAAMEDR